MNDHHLLTSTPPGERPNPHHKWHLVAYLPLVFIIVSGGALSSAAVLDSLWWIAAAVLFLAATFFDFQITDTLAGTLRRTWFERFCDAYTPLLVLMTSTGVSVLINEALHYSTGAIVTGSVIVSVVIVAVLVTVRETGSVGKVVKPKTVGEMEPEVRYAHGV